MNRHGTVVRHPDYGGDGMPGLGRRQFLRGAGALGAALASPIRLRAATTADVVVVGAGLAGLHTADLLARQGAKVVVLEGRRRPGGRVLTLDDVPGRPEAGGNAIGPSYARVLTEVRRNELELGPMRVRSDPGVAPTVLHYRGRYIADHDWADSPLNPFTGADRESLPWALQWPYYLKGNPLKNPEDWRKPEFAGLDTPLYDFAKQQGLSDAAIQLAFDRCQLYGTGVFDVSTLGMFQIMTLAAYVRKNFGAEQWAIKGGNQRLPEAMAARLKSPIHYGKSIVGIRSGSDGAEVHCTDGSAYRADKVVVTAPAPALRHVRFDPVLPRLTAEGIAQLGYACSYQIHFAAKSRFWEKDGLPLTMWTDGPIGRLTGLYYGDDPDTPSSIITFVNGARAVTLDRMPEAQAVAYVLELLARIRPSTRGQLTPLTVQSWQRDPFAGGMYSSWKPGQISRLADALAEPAGHIHFAGEHTARLNRGMEGAMESGERAAIEVLIALAG